MTEHDLAGDGPRPSGETGHHGRRTVLRAGAMLGVAGVAAPLLAACGNDNAATDAPATEEPTAQASGTIVAAAEVPVGGSVVKIVDDRKIVVTQMTKGQFKAFSAICTHNGCTVKGVDEGSILCVCHGSRFDATTGAVVNGPFDTPPSTIAPLTVIPVTVANGDVDFA